MSDFKPGSKNKNNLKMSARLPAGPACFESEERFKVLFEMSPHATFLETLQGKIIDCNSAASRLMGYTKKELLKMSAADLVPKKVRKLFPQIIKDELNKKTFHLQAENQRKNGEVFPVDVLGRVVNINRRKYVLVKVDDITERQRQITKLEDSEEMFRLLFTDITDGILVANQKTRKFFLANPAMERMLGRSQAEILKLGVSDIHPKDEMGRIAAHFEAAAKGKVDLIRDVAVARKDGSVFYADIRAYPFHFRGVKYAVGIFKDVTEKKMAEDKLVLENSKNVILHQIVSLANKAESLPKLLNDSLPPILKTLGFEGGGVYLVDKEKNRAEVAAAYNLQKKFLRAVRQIDIKKKPYNTIFVKGEPLITDHYDKLFPGRQRLANFKSLVSVPLIAGDEIIGALNIASEKRSVVPEAIKEILILVGKELGNAIRRVTTEERLKRHDEQFKTIVEHSLDIIYTFDHKGKVIFVTPNVARLGYSVKEIIGQSFKNFIHRDDLLRLYRELRLVTKTKKAFYSTFRLLKKDGGYIYVEEYGTPVFDEKGRPALFTGVMRDVSERKIAEEEKKNYTDRLKIMFEDAPDAYYLGDLRGTLIDGNKAAEKLTGFKKDELIGKSLLNLKDLVVPGQKAKMIKLLAKNARGQSTGPDEFALKQKGDSVITVEVSTHPVKIDGKSLVLGIARDVTEHKQTEQALQKERDISRNILNTAQAIIVILDVNGKIVSFNPYLEKISGYKMDEVKGADWFSTFLPSRDRAKIRKLFKTAVGDIATKGNVNPILTKNGKEVLVEWYDSTLKDEHGKIIGVLSTGQDVTDRFHAQENLKISEEKYRNVVENANELILIAQDALIKFVNPKVEEFLGYTNKELVPKSFSHFIYPEDLNMVATRYAKRIHGDKDLPDSYNFRVVDKSGRIKWVEINAVLINWEGRPATLNFLQDITVRKKAEDELSLRVEELEKTKTAMLNVLEDMQKEKAISESLTRDMERFKLAVEGVSEQIIITDPDAKIIFANPAAAKITGFSSEEMIGRNPGGLWGGKMDRDFFRRMWHTIKKDKATYQGELTNRRKDGEEYIAEVMITPILDKNGNVLFYVGIERDITKAKMIDQMKTEFVSVSSHQLRTPLTGIKWFAELLLAGKLGKLNAEQLDYIKQIYDSNERMVKLVNDLLDVSHIETGEKFLIGVKRTNIVPLLQSVIKEQSMVAKKKNITIDCVKGLTKPLTLSIDEDKIRQVFVNLIDNAVKYSSPNTMIKIGCGERKGKEMEFYVSNEGIGIPASQQKRMFEKFFRADNALSAEATGSGLGLYIANAIVERHGGKMWFKSSEGKGATFYFTLPL